MGIYRTEQPRFIGGCQPDAPRAYLSLVLPGQFYRALTDSIATSETLFVQPSTSVSIFDTLHATLQSYGYPSDTAGTSETLETLEPTGRIWAPIFDAKFGG